ncbi:ABC transporter ATP-binding protein [Pelagibacterium luteolum]|uniref:Iron complex transport system ATP-binding protein n=1 Tax=Pelagibacterium luteolum TaxID=440168 RepID=A0A1G7WIK6_9HYPH|nr:ABC transporter ATP-binding protein [Pelagibacterium luteolum]SDG71639.1 iron complex transport system ATP-binding protein [Pelagibacterium luteolum]
MASDILTLDTLSLTKGQAVLLDGVSFALQRGKFHALLGPNGAGKSSLMRVLYRAETDATGTVSLEGKPIKDWHRKAYAAKVGALVQESVSLSGLTLAEVVILGLLPLALSRDEAQARCAEALGLVGLANRATEDATHLSGGEQQRLFFAQLLALDPDIYILDEPHNHLDLHYQYVLLDIVRRRGKTVLASFHDLTLATRFCDHAFLLDHGRLAASGTLAEVLTPERLASVYRIDADFTGGALSIRGAIV